MTSEEIYRIARLSLRARRITRELVKKHGWTTAAALVRERERAAQYHGTYMFWTLVGDNLYSYWSGCMHRD